MQIYANLSFEMINIRISIGWNVRYLVFCVGSFFSAGNQVPMSKYPP